MSEADPKNDNPSGTHVGGEPGPLSERPPPSVRKFLLAVEQAENVIFMADPSGEITYVNPAFEKTYGFSKEEAIGATPRILKSGRHDAAFYAELWRALLSGEAYHGEIVNRARDGRLVTVDLSARQVFDADGKTMGFIAVQHDVTERRRLEEQFRQAQKMESIGRLAGGVAHDFNNLLTAILGYAGLLEAREPLGAAAREDLNEIRTAAERAAALTRQLLAFSRKQVLAPSVLSPNELVAGVERMLHRLIGEDVDLSARLDPSVGNIRVDAGQLEQVLVNLAVNARDAMPEGGKLTIETGNAVIDKAYAAQHVGVSPGRYVMLAVSDTGMGMSDETRSQIFEPFFTTKELGKGTGLGLATVYGIVHQSGGHIFVYSEPGKGSTFKLYFPLVEGAPSETGAAAPGPELEIARGSETILIAEDEPAVRTLAGTFLSGKGYRILQAAGGAEALTLAERFPDTIHLLLTDVVMPDMSGPDLEKQLRARRPELRVLYMSGYTDDGVVRNGMLEGRQLYLQKPFTPRTLAGKVREALYNRGHGRVPLSARRGPGLGDPVAPRVPAHADGRRPLDVPGRDRSRHLLPGLSQAQ
jgi:PAS domain S-box-containing protein